MGAIKALKCTESVGLQVSHMHHMADRVDERQEAGKSAARNLEKKPGIIKNIMQLLLFCFFTLYTKLAHSTEEQKGLTSQRQTTKSMSERVCVGRPKRSTN